MTAWLTASRAGTAAVAVATLALVPAQASSAADSTTGCAVGYAVPVHWPGGFEAILTIRNSGTALVDGWTLRFPYPQGVQIISRFNTGGLSYDGPAVQLTNAPFNGTLAPGATVLVGLVALASSTPDPPAWFTLNGTQCTTS